LRRWFFNAGAVIASNGDSSVLFYNPALLAGAGKSSISFSGSLYQIDRINLVDGAGTSRNLTSQNFSVVPQIIAGSFKIPFKKPFQVAYALLHDPGLNFQPTQRRDENVNALDDSYSPGEEEFIGQLVYQNEVDQFSGLVAAGYSITPTIKIGGAMEAIQRKQTYALNFTGRALVNTTSIDQFPIVSNDSYYFTQYSFYSLRWKAGFAYDVGDNHLGLLIHTPDLPVYSSGTLLSDNVLVNLRIIPDERAINFVANTRQDKLKVKWKNPVSIGAGYSYNFPRGLIYVSAEYFFGVPEYNVLTPRKDFFLRPDTGNSNLLTPDLLSLKDKRNPVLNFSAGANVELDEKVTAFFSFRTDYSYADVGLEKPQIGFTPYTTFWNNFHWGAGINLRKKSFNLHSGVFHGVRHFTRLCAGNQPG
jgi:hypothetical protein